jgi:hypothetical protein
MRNRYKILVESHEGRRLFGRHTCRWEKNIKTDLKVDEICGAYCNYLA